MRHFIVLGFKTSANSEEGTVVHKGADCHKATAVVNAPEKGYVRKEMYELAIPKIRKNHPPSVDAAAEAEAKAAAEAEAKAAAEAEAKAAAENAGENPKQKKTRS